MQKITPCLWFDDQAEEAVRFYASIFPNSRVDRVTALESESPSGPPGTVKVVDFTLMGQRLQAKGSTFTVWLPVKPQGDTASAAGG